MFFRKEKLEYCKDMLILNNKYPIEVKKIDDIRIKKFSTALNFKIQKTALVSLNLEIFCYNKTLKIFEIENCIKLLKQVKIYNNRLFEMIFPNNFIKKLVESEIENVRY